MNVHAEASAWMGKERRSPRQAHQATANLADDFPKVRSDRVSFCYLFPLRWVWYDWRPENRGATEEAKEALIDCMGQNVAYVKSTRRQVFAQMAWI